MHETSMNFDQEKVSLFLERLIPHIDSGFGTLEIHTVLRLIESLFVDEDGEVKFPITYQGQDIQLTVQVAMDDIEAPDVYFFSENVTLIRMIDLELGTFCKEQGI